ncbi:MAG TPA: class I tRNA ligase family protein, partial [Burkholderiaceae bacterium]|nr:class I tRNA ligase family protein [Burkholderiaceae bacterium]
ASSDAVLRESLGILLRVLYPIAPHITHALWGELGFGGEFGELLDAPWPKPDPDALKADMIELVVQVNGKLRGSVRVPASADRAAIESAVLAQESVQRYVTGPIRKTVIVPGKLVNVVV